MAIRHDHISPHIFYFKIKVTFGFRVDLSSGIRVKSMARVRVRVRVRGSRLKAQGKKYG